MRPVWPTRASSRNQTSSRSASGWSRATSAISFGNFFEAFLGLEVGFGVHGARLLPRQAEVVEPPEHAVLGIADAEAVLDEPTEILGAPGADAVALRVRAAQHQRLQRRQLTVIEPGRAAALGPITQTFDPLDVEPDDPIPERLTIHPGQAGGLAAIHAVQRVGQTQQPRRHAAVGLPAGQAAQPLRRDVGADRCR